MGEQYFSTSGIPEIIIEEVGGSLSMKGWERPEVVVKGDPEELNASEQDDAVTIRSRGDLSLRVPQGSSVRVDAVRGDVSLKLLDDELTIQDVSGSLDLRNVGGVNITAVRGDLSARNVQGDFSAETVNGSVSVRNVQGDCLLPSVSGDAEVRNVTGEVKVQANGSIGMRLNRAVEGDHSIRAQGDVEVRLPTVASLKVTISSRGQSIRLKLPNGNLEFDKNSHEFTLGEGAGSLVIDAGGSVVISARGEENWGGFEEAEEAGDFSFPSDLNEQIARQIEAQMEAISRQMNEQITNLSATIGRAGLSAEDSEQIMRRARESSERATARAQEKMKRAQEKLERKLEAARRRNEAKAQGFERRAQGPARRSWGFEWPMPPTPPAPPRSPATEEERLMILKMLEQKKISLEEAEKLLAALEGKAS
jgi:hypothetical protein